METRQGFVPRPDSGTGQLVGLAGKMTINVAGGKHSYDFEYTLRDSPPS